MTACTMSSDYGTDLLLGSSPIVGSGFHGSGGSSFFSDYPRCGSPAMVWDNNTANAAAYYPGNLMTADNSNSLSSVDSCRTYARTGSLRRSKKLSKLKAEFQQKPLLLTIPAKSILRTQEELPQEEAVLTSPNKEKKKVCFADALGQQLAQIKLITERPDCPPLWSAAFIEKVTGGLPQETAANQWELTFSQPASDYMNFKLKLDRDNVALENVLLEEQKGILKGTVKVRNLSFHKDVYMKYTSDNWSSSDEMQATYIPAPSTMVAYDLYDRFSFEIPLPDPKIADKLEFCVRFMCGETEYWDNYNGRNYVVISFRSKSSQNSNNRLNDSYHMNMQSWSEFASWNQLDQSGSPYW